MKKLLTQYERVGRLNKITEIYCEEGKKYLYNNRSNSCAI